MKALMIVVPILVVGGVLGAGFMGVLNIPGLTPKKAQAKAQAQYGEPTDPATAVSEETEQAEEPTAGSTVVASDVETDAQQGTTAIAKIWAELPPKKVIEISGEYKDDELATILLAMPRENVATILGQLPADKAAKLSKEMQRIASIVPEGR